MDYIEKFIQSKTKHKIIQGVIYKAFDIETLGRGLKRMDKYCKEANVQWDYIKYPFGFSFIFIRNNKAVKEVNLSLEAIKILNYMKGNNGILENKEKACLITNRKERSASTIIAELVKNGKIERIGSNKTGYWKVLV